MHYHVNKQKCEVEQKELPNSGKYSLILTDEIKCLKRQR